ncbi:MAG: rod shape-determining protein MreD [Candidatus Azobacteroides sp.]|nr:rod shape-determining protein MreD [Candidatus Azobacteroides sp.]
MSTILRYSLFFLVVVIIQIFILNGMNFLGYATPFIYIYFIIKLPVDINKNILLILSFLLGFIIDIFCNTPGINAAATVFAGFLRPYLIPALVTLDTAENRNPSIQLFGLQPFLRYIGVLIFIHHALLLTFESFSLFDPLVVLLRIVACSLFTFVLIWAMEGLTVNHHKR